MTVEQLIERLLYEASQTLAGIQTKVGFATSPSDNVEVASIYFSPEDGKIWIDLE